MRQEVIMIGTQAKQMLLCAERNMDLSTAACAELLANLLHGRTALNLGVQFEAETIAEVGRMVTTGLEARSQAINVHARLLGLAERWRMQDDLGDGGDKEGNWIVKDRGLNVVHAHAA